MDCGQYPVLANPYQFFSVSGPELAGLVGQSPGLSGRTQHQQHIKVSQTESDLTPGMGIFTVFDSLRSDVLDLAGPALPCLLIINLLGISQIISTLQKY